MLNNKLIPDNIDKPYENEVEVTCDNYDCSSNGYFYFYDEVDGRRKILCTYPVERTALHEIEIIETEY